MAFEEQFSQISEFAQAKIALEQEQTRRRKLDRIAEETRQRQTELFDVQLRQARQQADDNQRKLDMAQLEQKHTADLASAWVAMMGEADKNETLSRKGAGTGSITTRTGSREQTAILSPSGRVVVSESAMGPVDTAVIEALDALGRPLPSDARQRVYQAERVVQYKVPGASSTAKDAYRQALIAAAREAPGAIEIFAKISQAHVQAENMPEQLKLANESVRALMDYREGKTAGGRGGMSLEDQKRQYDLYNSGLQQVKSTISPETPADIIKRGEEQRMLLKDKQAAQATSIGQKVSLLNLNAEVNDATKVAVDKAKKPNATSFDYQALLTAALTATGTIRKTFEAGSPEGTAYQDLVTEIGAYRDNIIKLEEAKRANDSEVQTLHQQYAYGTTLYDEYIGQGMNHNVAAQRAGMLTNEVSLKAAAVERKLMVNPDYVNPADPETGGLKAAAVQAVDNAVSAAYGGTVSSPEAVTVRQLLIRKMADKGLTSIFKTQDLGTTGSASKEIVAPPPPPPTPAPLAPKAAAPVTKTKVNWNNPKK